jgi:hypothetical protein
VFDTVGKNLRLQEGYWVGIRRCMSLASHLDCMEEGFQQYRGLRRRAQLRCMGANNGSEMVTVKLERLWTVHQYRAVALPQVPSPKLVPEATRCSPYMRTQPAISV